MTKLLGILMVFVLCTPSWSITGDLDGDGDVDFDDFFLFSDNFGKTGEVETIDCGEETEELLVWTTTWGDGSVKEQYQYYINSENNRLIKHGWYNSYDENGDFDEEGTYKDNERDGEWVSLYDGILYARKSYQDGALEGKYISYNSDGGVSVEKTYVNDELTFEKFYLHTNGQLSSEGHFGDDFTNYKSYNEKGLLTSESYFVDGERDGRWVEYDDEGNITDEDIYENGVCVEKCEGDE
jgi:uncharacterized protein